jgi:segregation and condensation protein A
MGRAECDVADQSEHRAAAGGADLVTPHAAPGTPHAAPYRVSLDLFEGPLDLLLHLIKKDEIDITNIPIARITEQYLGYLDLMRELNLDVAGEYLVMAATLLLIKSRLLLPAPEGAEEDEEEDPRRDLVRQLLEYQRYREAAQALAERPLLHRDVYAREPNAEGLAADAAGRPFVRATTWELLEAFRAVLKRARPDPIHEVVAESVSLRERVEYLLRTLGVARAVEFDSLFDDGASRLEIIVTFLALLELMKVGAIEAVQDERFGQIRIVLVVDDVRTVSLDLADEYDGSRRDEAAARAAPAGEAASGQGGAGDD